MAEKVILSNDYATMWLDEEHGIVHHKFHKFIFGDAFREVMLTGAALMERPGVSKWLSDDRLNSALPKADMDWGEEHWAPRVMKAGWKYWALVLPEKLVGQLNMKQLTAMYGGMGVTVQVFSELEPARAWLEAQ